MINKNLMRRIAQETLNFVKKNRYMSIDFVRVLRRALFVLFIENLFNLILQITAAFVSDFNKTIKNTTMIIPIAATIFFVIVVFMIMIIQVKRNLSLLLILKFIEFILFLTILSRLTSFHIST